jgi:periplasmic protein CpxP/Spy
MLAVMSLAIGPVVAQSAAAAPAPAPGPNAASGATVEARVNQRVAQMHQRLKITPAQESAWEAFAKVMRDNVTSTDDAYRQRAATIATMSAPDNMRNFARIEQDRAQGVQTLAASFQALYDTLSDDQKKIADTMFRHYGDRAAAHRPASQ